jgi:hypothetical protein
MRRLPRGDAPHPTGVSQRGRARLIEEYEYAGL